MKWLRVPCVGPVEGDGGLRVHSFPACAQAGDALLQLAVLLDQFLQIPRSGQEVPDIKESRRDG